MEFQGRHTKNVEEVLKNIGKSDSTLHGVELKRVSYAPSTSSSSVSRGSNHPSTTAHSTPRLADFFGTDVLQMVLHDPTISHQLYRFSKSRLCGENLEFLEQVDRYNGLLKEVAKAMSEIQRAYISTSADDQINIPESMLCKVNRDVQSALTTALPTLESVFDECRGSIERLVADDIYPRFVRHQMTIAASKALAQTRAGNDNQSKYAGLGDCFVLTSPNRADNPIVYPSDGFIKVTGYSRNDIIPRNCRFLQCRSTDPAAVERLRRAIQGREEVVELLLNQKKSGEPFWNLLYMTPLLDATGKAVFFLGGQINCSTTIHHTSDAMRILALSGDSDADTVETQVVEEPQKQKTRTERLFASLRGKPQRECRLRLPGMEDEILSKIETDKMNLQMQKDTLYTAYSRFVVVNMTTFCISFHSRQMTTMLQPLGSDQVKGVPAIVGTDVFHFLSAYSPNKVTGDFKTRIKSATVAGNAISMEITLSTRRLAGYEKFVSHWTPLKDDAGEVTWVVVTLGSRND
ncbi:hypothetical protein PV10_07656 [Exophiala mesophila]|uniref:RGS domain-containing protein n=1 Tax=Exophiala mesophila TaxID=212818 RepID=A0A0D1Z8G2_EXOME|nr:uncharacterized protein PV10_07656 [Exophiala mesophila]KIV90344.1 hypothetical protein PV10_07656 [Exophiala mesophila]